MATRTPRQPQWHDWVGELFEPVFGQTVDDLVAGEDEPKHKPAVKHISVHDPEAVKKVLPLCYFLSFTYSGKIMLQEADVSVLRYLSKSYVSIFNLAY